jgi:hypothetical protein
LSASREYLAVEEDPLTQWVGWEQYYFTLFEWSAHILTIPVIRQDSVIITYTIIQL